MGGNLLDKIGSSLETIVRVFSHTALKVSQLFQPLKAMSNKVKRGVALV